jgi:hypothetical protein
MDRFSKVLFGIDALLAFVLLPLMLADRRPRPID